MASSISAAQQGSRHWLTALRCVSPPNGSAFLKKRNFFGQQRGGTMLKGPLQLIGKELEDFHFLAPPTTKSNLPCSSRPCRMTRPFWARPASKSPPGEWLRCKAFGQKQPSRLSCSNARPSHNLSASGAVTGLPFWKGSGKVAFGSALGATAMDFTTGEGSRGKCIGAAKARAKSIRGQKTSGRGEVKAGEASPGESSSEEQSPEGSPEPSPSDVSLKVSAATVATAISASGFFALACRLFWPVKPACLTLAEATFSHILVAACAVILVSGGFPSTGTRY